jgi:hypothetical protein
VFEHCRLAVGGAALLHDVGHPPYSHVLEPLYVSLAPEHLAEDPEWLTDWRDLGVQFHEFAGRRLAQQIVRDVGSALGPLIVAILESDAASSTWVGSLHAIVAGEVDVDRLDYLMRDAQKAGTEFGAIDYARLVDALELHEEAGRFNIAPGIRARSAVETLLLQRTQAYKWITFHTRVVSSNLALARAMETFRRLSVGSEALGAGAWRTARDAFGPSWPRLNYIAPAVEDLSRELEGEIPAEANRDQITLDDPTRQGLLKELRAQLQAGVDDMTVTEGLKRAALLARGLSAMEDAQPPKAVRTTLTRFLTYAQHALFRWPNALTAWKTVEEFTQAACDMEDDLVAAVSDGYAKVKEDPEMAGRQDAIAVLDEKSHELCTLIRDDPVVGTNRVVTMLFDDEPGNMDALARMLTEERDHLDVDLPGAWDAAYTGFTAVKQGHEAAVLFDGDEQVELFPTSPLAQALQQVEASRYRLCVFFFIDYPGRVPAGEPGQSRELRGRLLGDFIATFPAFVRSNLPDVIRQSHGPPEPEHTT